MSNIKTVGELRAVIADLPDDMLLAVYDEAYGLLVNPNWWKTTGNKSLPPTLVLSNEEED